MENTQDWHNPIDVQAWLTSRRGSWLRTEMVDLIIAILTAHQPSGLRILDLGCGDGEIGARILTTIPGSHWVGLDNSLPMRQSAADQLRPFADRAAIYPADFGTPLPPLSEAPFDAVLASQSVHHLDAPGKQALFHQVAALLRPGGLFLLSDRIHLDTPALFPYFLAVWNHLNRARSAPPLPTSYDYPAHLATLVARADRPDTVEDQLHWLQAAGFHQAACFWRYAERAIFGGLLGPPSGPITPGPIPPDIDVNGAL